MALQNKSKEQLIKEVLTLRQKIQQLKSVEAEFKRNEAALRKEKEIAQRYFEVAEVIFLVLNRRGQVKLINKMGCKLLGYEENEIVGKNWFTNFLPANIRSRVRNKFNAFVSGDVEVLRYFENPISTKMGEERMIAWHNTLLKDDKGKAVATLSSGIDITERKRTEEALRESEAQNQAIVNTAADGIIIIDAKGLVTSFNAAAEKIFGYKKAEIIGQNIKMLMSTPFQEKHNGYIRKYLKTGKKNIIGYSREVTGKRKDGQLITLLISVSELQLERKKLFTGIVRDITLFKNTEAALRRSEDRYRKLLETVTDYIYTVKIKNGKEVETIHSPGCIAVTGYRPEDYYNDPNLWHRMVHEEDWVAVIQHARKILADEDVQIIEHRILHKDGSVRWVRNTRVPRFDERGNLIAYDGLIADITERKLAEEALRHSEELYKMVVQNTNEIILIVQNGQIKFFNPKLLSLTGYSKEELAAKPFIDLFHPQDQSIISLHISKKQQNDKESIINSYRLVDKNGHIKWMDINVVFINWEGQSANLCFFTDITERKFLQEELARAQRLETAGRVAGQIAHDFNNLLSPLAAYPTLIREELENSAAISDMLDEMEDSATKIAEINQQLLALGRRGHYTMEPIDLNTLVHKVVMANNLSKDITIRENLAPDLFIIKGGVAQLTRALVNLISNAKEAMPGSGVLTISTENAYLEKPLRGYACIARGEYVLLKITDTGVGMSSDVLGKIFDPFFTTKCMDRERGSGLGLSVVHGIIEDHHGYILVDSQKNKGTTFSIYLPVSRKYGKELARVVEQSKGGSESILVVDDDPIQRRVASQLLKRLGYKVHSASSGESAVNHVKKRSYDLLIIDMIMDGIDGVEAYRRILEMNQHQKAIILSGYARSNKVKEALRLGAGAFISKPISPKILAIQVRKELDRKSRKKRRLSV
ncbi:MAG: PAS domain S-box protein [bacterium]